jgi:hypothetical protein
MQEGMSDPTVLIAGVKLTKRTLNNLTEMKAIIQEINDHKDFDPMGLIP